MKASTNKASKIKTTKSKSSQGKKAPKITKKTVNKVEDKIKQTLETVRPGLQSDGGDIEFVSFNKKTGVVTVSLTGMCTSCPMSQITLKEGVEVLVKKEVPEVKSVVSV